MASSALSSVIGNPLSAGSVLCFLSFAAAGIAALAGNSTVSDKMQATERMAARKDLGVAEIAGIHGKNGEEGRSCKLIALSCRDGLSGTFPVTNRITLGRRRSCTSPEIVSNPTTADRGVGRGIREPKRDQTKGCFAAEW